MGRGMKNVFNQVKNNICNTWCLGVALLPLYDTHPIDLLCKSMARFLCNGNTDMN